MIVVFKNKILILLVSGVQPYAVPRARGCPLAEAYALDLGSIVRIVRLSRRTQVEYVHRETATFGEHRIIELNIIDEYRHLASHFPLPLRGAADRSRRDDRHVRAGLPDLVALLAIPAPAQDVLAGRQALGNAHVVHDLKGGLCAGAQMRTAERACARAGSSAQSATSRIRVACGRPGCSHARVRHACFMLARELGSRRR